MINVLPLFLFSDIWAQMTSITPLALAYTAPLLIIALGGLYSERSGVVNVGLEGLLGVGAFSAAIFISKTSPTMGMTAVWLGLLIGALSGALFSLLHAFASVTMRANQIISGTAINILSMALTVYVARLLNGSSNVQILDSFVKSSVPLLSQIPIIGPLLFQKAYTTTFVVLGIVAFTWYLIYKTPFGLRLRACGENPHAADSMGINVARMRYIGVMISGALAGLGGAIIITTYSREFSQLTYNGLGFLALAALIFGKWDPRGVLGASVFFGLATTVASISKVYESFQQVPNIFLNTFPYVVTLVGLVLFSKNAAGPRAAGEPYDKGKR